jgi:phage-related protein
MELFKLFGTIAIQNADANEQIDDTTDRAKESESKISSAFKKIGGVVATALAVDKIKDFGLNCINAAADANAASSQFSQVFGDMESQAKKSLTGIADNTGIQVKRMKGSYTQIAAFAKTTGMDTSKALGLADRAMVAVADSAAFYDRTLEDTTESLQSFLKGNYENDSALGLSCTEVTRNEAANRLYGKSFKDLSEAQKQLTLLQMVEDANKASGALGQAARESDTWTNQTGNLKQAWQDFQAILGQNVLPLAVTAVKKMASAVQGVSEKVPTMIEWFNKYKGVVVAVTAVVSVLTAAVGVHSAVQAVKSAMNTAEATSLGVLIAAKWADVTATAAMLAPYIAIIGAIAALAAGVIYCYNHFETFRNIVNGVAEWIKSNLAAAFEFLKPYIEAIISAVGELVSAIGDRLMQAFQWIVDKITEVYNSSSPIVQAIKTLFITHFENIKVYITTVFNVIKTVVSTVMTVIKQIIQTITAAIKGDWSGVWNGIKAIFSTIWDAIKSIVSTVLNAIKTIISNTLNTVKGIISNVLNAIKSIFTSIWDTIKSKVSAVIESVKSIISSGLNTAKSVISGILDSIKSKFGSIFESAKEIVRSAIDKIKGFFNFSWSLPKIKLPHFSISGKFSLDPPSIPHFSWIGIKKAMDNPVMFTKPTIFSMNPATGRAKGAGEAGDELMIGKETMLNMIRQAVAEGQLSDRKTELLLQGILNWLSEGGLKEMLVDILVNYVSISINDREVARVVRKYA